MAKPVHRQFGSKARVAPMILGLVPPGKKVWVEVFAGTAAITITKAPHPVEHINDLSGHVVNLFRVVRDQGLCVALQEAISLTPYAVGEMKACQSAIRVADDPVEWARRFLVSSWQSANGCHTGNTGFRMNRKADWHLGVWNRLPERIASACARLKEVTIHQTHCVDLVGKFADLETACLFVDPPYPLKTTNTQRQQVYEHDMTEDEHRRLCEELRKAKGSVIVTMNPGTIYSEALMDWNVLEITVRGLRNATKKELVFTNFDPNTANLLAAADMRGLRHG